MNGPYDTRDQAHADASGLHSAIANSPDWMRREIPRHYLEGIAIVRAGPLGNYDRDVIAKLAIETPEIVQVIAALIERAYENGQQHPAKTARGGGD